MATTTNYGWTTPNDTDLVKDGAAAIRTLGSSIDTTTKNLNPQTTTGALAYRSATANVNTALPIGTANQVLRVNSGGTAPEWATTADQTPLTTKGDLFGFDTADARIPIGTNGHILTADSTQSLGLKWAAPAAGGGMTLLSTTTLSGSSSVTVSGISSAYNDLHILIQNPYQAAANGDLYVYFAQSMFIINIYTTSVAESTQIRGQVLLGNTSRPANNNYCIIIKNYADATFGKPVMYWGNASANNDSTFGAGVIRDTSAISQFTIEDPSGLNTNFSGGQIQVYGVK
jgi:hypothetical protein